jgi:LacI family transcriptional regulator
MSDVAKLAGVSIMTVSRVLNGTVNVSADADARVRKAVETLNYLPNEVARSLRISRTHQIGVIVPNLHDPFFAVCANAISLMAKQRSYSTVITTSDEDPAVEYTEAKRMLRRHIDGLIIIPTNLSRLRGPDFEEMPIVTLDRPIPGGAFDSVIVRNKSGAEMGVRHLIEHHHRRIACVGLDRQRWTIGERMDGYCKAMLEAGLKPDIHTTTESQDEMFKTIRTLISLPKRPSAIFCTNNLITRNVLHSLSALNVAIPQDMALIGFDDFDMADIIKPAVTVVRQPVDTLGRIATELLFSRLSAPGRMKKARRTIIPVELAIRASCGPHA